MRLCWVPLVLWTAACAPPDAFEIPFEPAIEILYPPDGVDIAVDPVEGILAFTLVVDVDELELIEPTETTGNVTGQGHYHIYVNNRYEGPVAQNFYDYASEPNEFDVGTPMSIRVSLASNNHGDLDMYPQWEDIIEFLVAAPESR